MDSHNKPKPIAYPPGFKTRRHFNWLAVGLMYASFYMCRYNFRWASPDMMKEFHYTYSDITIILGAWSWAYGVGQLVNGLFTDRIGGKRAMLIGAVGTVLANFAFGASSTMGSFSTFTMIWVVNGYVQAFGAPGNAKINAAWFSRTERGTFAGIWGLTIQMGQVAINKLAPALMAGFTLFLWTVPKLDWHWLFWVPPAITAVVSLGVIFVVKETPEEAGFQSVHHGESATSAEDVRVPLKEAFLTIVKHPLVWFYAVAYACTGAVRHGSDHLAILYFVNELKLDKSDPAMVWTLQLMPIVAVAGSFAAGAISDRYFQSRRAPVAMVLYFVETVVILFAVGCFVGFGIKSVVLSCFFLVGISLTANSTHSIVGVAAPMDIGGRRMAGFALGVIDSFQYFGSGVALPVMGWLLDKYGWSTWFPAMAGFGLVGGLAMWVVSIRQKRLQVHGG